MQQLVLDSVSRTYQGFFALHRISSTFRCGELTALVGDNGSGKTTLLNVLATLDPPTDGEISYDELDWEEFAETYRDRVGWIAHESLSYGELTGRENLEFYARMYGVEAPSDVAADWLERVGLKDAADRRASHYSRGMLQRLTIARALLHDPDLLLLDEPLTGLDRGGRATVIELLESMRSRRKLVLMASHDLDAVDRVADRVTVLRRGRLAYTEELDSGPNVAELYREYA